jgi:Tol biopolymer transport system component
VTVAERVGVDPTQPIGAFSVSQAGSVVYRVGGTQRQLTWYDRSGRPIGTMGAPDETHRGPEISPDGRRVVVERTVQGNTDLWLYDEVRSSKFTFGAGAEDFPHWSGDGRNVVFRAGPNRDFFQRSLGAGGAEGDALVLKASSTLAPNDWSPDGRYLLYIVVDPKTSSDIWVLPMNGDRKPEKFLDSPFTERNAQFSPDGRWVAYQSDESGRFEIYVRPFLRSGSQSPVSVDGGVAPRWRADGKELYYVAPDGTLMAAPLTTNGTSIEPGRPAPLFRPRILFGGSNPVGVQWQYDVAPDGRFLVNVETNDAGPEPLRLIVNWNPVE